MSKLGTTHLSHQHGDGARARERDLATTSVRLRCTAEDALMPEQRRVRASSTVTLPCYAARPSDDTTTDHFSAGARPRRRATRAATARGDDVTTRRKLRHNRRAEAAGDRWHYEWRRDDRPIDMMTSSSGGGGRHSVDTRDHSLTIRNVSSAVDTAMYACLRRRHGNSSTSNDVITSRQIQLVVQGRR